VQIQGHVNTSHNSELTMCGYQLPKNGVSIYLALFELHKQPSVKIKVEKVYYMLAEVIIV
jgi:hypothetical protein